MHQISGRSEPPSRLGGNAGAQAGVQAGVQAGPPHCTNGICDFLFHLLLQLLL